MRVTLPLGQAGVVLAAVAVAVVALFPLRVALDIAHLPVQYLTARRADGSLWLGRLRDARLMGAPLGDVVTSLSPWQLLLGSVHVRVRGERLKGALVVSRRGLGVDEMSGQVPGFALAPGMVTGPLSLQRLSLVFGAGRCQQARGTIRIVLLPSRLVPSRLTLAGRARCDKTALVVPLTDDQGRGRLDIQVWPGRRYQLRLRVAGAQSDEQLAAGFSPGPSGLELTVEGEL